MLKKKAVVYMLIMALLASFTLIGGCQQSETADQPGGDSAVEQQDGTRTIVDMMGREVTIPAEINKAATTWRVSTYLVHAVGAQDKLVAVDDGSTQAPFITAAYPPIKDLTKIGDKKHGINIESIASAQPEVVFIWSGKETEDMLDKLANIGIPAVVLIPENEEDMKTATLLVGDILGCSEQAEKIIKYYDDTLTMVADKLADIPEEQKTRVYLAGAYGVLSSCGSDFYQHYLIECAGGANVAADLSGGWQDVSPEQLVAWNPEIIVADPYCKEDMEDAVKMDPGLSAIEAVKNDQVYSMPKVGQWSFPIPQSAMGILWLATTLYPDEFADLDLAAEVDAYYQEFFGVNYTEIIGSDKLDGKGIAGAKQ